MEKLIRSELASKLKDFFGLFDAFFGTFILLITDIYGKISSALCVYSRRKLTSFVENVGSKEYERRSAKEEKMRYIIGETQAYSANDKIELHRVNQIWPFHPTFRIHFHPLLNAFRQAV